MKKEKMFFWSTTIVIFIMEGLIPAFTSQTELAKEGIKHLGYPEYFGTVLVIFKVLGALTLIIPQMPKQLKEFAYAGFTFILLFASISHNIVDGFGFQTILPLLFLVILGFSYFYYHKLNMAKN